MISVLFLIPTLDRGGAENVLVDLVNHMDQNKFQITVQTLFDRKSQKKRLRPGIKYKSFLYHQFRGNSRLMSLIPPKLLYRLIVRKRYDVIVSYLEGPTTRVISGCPYEDSKTVSWVHVEMDNERQLSVGFRSMDQALQAYQRFDKVAFVAKTVRDSFFNVSKTRLKNDIVLYNTVNSKLIIKKSLRKTEEEIFSKEEFNIISVGRIIPAKGYDRLVHIQKKLREAGYKTHVYILGSGNDQEKLQEYAQENGITETFTFLGFKQNPYQLVSQADLFVCSSRREGFSTAVTEALILGVPVVSANCSGAYELLGDHNEYGIVTENEEEALLEGIRLLLDDPQLLNHYRRQAKIRGKFFNTKNTVRAVEEMLSNLSGGE